MGVYPVCVSENNFCLKKLSRDHTFKEKVVEGIRYCLYILCDDVKYRQRLGTRTQTAPFLVAQVLDFRNMVSCMLFSKPESLMF